MKYLFWSVLVFAFILRLLLFFAVFKNNPDNFYQPDSGVYVQIADNLLKAGIFSSSNKPPLEPEYNRTPAYPVFISAFRKMCPGVIDLILFQILISTVSVYLVMYFCRTLLKLSDTASLLSGIILALDIPSIVLSNSILTETLFTFLLLTGIIFLARYFKTHNIILLVSGGVMFGLCSLCRPSALLLPLFSLAAFFFIKDLRVHSKILASAIFLFVYMMVLSPWLIRNNAVFGGAFLSTISYDNLLYVQAAGVRSVRDNISLDKAREMLLKEFESRHSDDIKNASLLKIKKLEGHDALQIIDAHPFIYAVNYWRSVLNMLLKPIRNDIDLMLGFRQAKTRHHQPVA